MNKYERQAESLRARNKPFRPPARVEYERVNWGGAGCGAPHCSNAAELLWDGELFCIGCADLVFERLIIMEQYPGVIDRLPDLWEADNPFAGA